MKLQELEDGSMKAGLGKSFYAQRPNKERNESLKVSLGELGRLQQKNNPVDTLPQHFTALSRTEVLLML